MAMDTEYSYGATLYFIIYIFLVQRISYQPASNTRHVCVVCVCVCARFQISVLFGPLFIGLMCDAYVILLTEIHRADEANKMTKKSIARATANEGAC
jgi:hypothetical protein